MSPINKTYYISHGSPMLAIDESLPARKFLQSWKLEILKEKPKAILVISGHWDTEHPSINIVDKHDTIYDFYNFPNALYQLRYTPPGAPELAKRVKELLLASDFKNVKEDKKRGVDHGAWIPLILMYPEADIPVCQLSVQSHEDGTYHFNMGKALAPLKEEGFLIFGSGAATHNLRKIQPPGSPVNSWALEFDTWLKNALLEGRYEDVNQYVTKAPFAQMAHPNPDHFFPLHVAMGAAGEDAKAELIHHSWDRGTLSYASYQFSPVH